MNVQEKNAPEGGNAYVDVATGDADKGAVGLVANAGCTDPTDWSVLDFQVYLPAYPAGDASALVADDQQILWTD